MRRALELDPLNPLTGSLAAELLVYAHAYAEAEAEGRRVLMMVPAYRHAHLVLAWLYDLRGQGGQAAGEYALAGILSPEQEHALADSFRASGMQGFQAWLLDTLESSRIPSGKGRFFHMATRYASLGDRGQALHFLEQAIRQHDSYVLLSKVNPWLDPLRSDPRFQELLRGIGIPD